MSIADNLADIRRRITTAAQDWQRDPAEVALVAVSKTHPAEAVLEAIAAGQHVFGENRVQEAAGKFPALRQAHALELHLIGPLQTNKVKEAVALFDVIQTVDRAKLADALAAEYRKQQRFLPCYIQINTGEEPQKAGIAPAEADGFIRYCREDLGLPVKGLMCIPPNDQHPAPHFALLREIARRHHLPGLSMGMSGDYELAIQFGATAVRVGTAVFGSRPYPVAAQPEGDK
ncbi:MAG TPA: YggS family pyridoxal phosphate-dependent enzyme [Terriglobales bacterium]|nr:YggS family pyridoxal phosphate-dependent enzyme [Terriglobales bacterium]